MRASWRHGDRAREGAMWKINAVPRRRSRQRAPGGEDADQEVEAPARSTWGVERRRRPDPRAVLLEGSDLAGDQALGGRAHVEPRRGQRAAAGQVELRRVVAPRT